MATVTNTIRQLDAEVADCARCPRLIDWCAQVAREKRAAYRDFDYWGGPVPSFGPADARLLIVGLAPGAHGANRTGRMFTGDRSGDWLFGALYRAGFASQAESRERGDGLALADARITGALHCAPPANRPTAQEEATCLDYLVRELRAMLPVVVVALGGLAWRACLRALPQAGWHIPSPRPPFGHGAEVALDGANAAPARPIVLLGSYHPSQQNTFTGRLTEPMLDAVFHQARRLLER